MIWLTIINMHTNMHTCLAKKNTQGRINEHFKKFSLFMNKEK